ncbi:MAG: sarcosine oxidase, partial [Rhizobiales bacterium]|nr:sarcosine oxidase [Hyphomicrobiales bacterium]
MALFEQGPVPNPKASSHDEHRMTRHCYGTLAGYGLLMPQAFRAYEELWSDLGARHFRPTKFLYVTREQSDWPAATARDLDRMGIPHRPLTP